MSLLWLKTLTHEKIRGIFTKFKIRQLDHANLPRFKKLLLTVAEPANNSNKGRHIRVKS